jgi:hypothetical protein
VNPLLIALKPLCADDMFHALSHLPASLELVEMNYICASKADIQNNRTAFNRDVKPEFLKYLAENNAAELSVMGLNMHAIARMLEGDMPENIRGQQLNVSVDHILSLHFGGTNAFENLALLPMQLNALKDKLETLQLEKDKKQGTLITIMPKRMNGKYPAVPFIEGGFTRARLYA